MKKHIFGFVLFGLIVASFALVYAFFNAPSIPPRETVQPPVAQTETREEKPYYCNIRRNKLSYEVQGSQFFLDENKVISKIKITWNGYAKAPNKVYLDGHFFTLENKNSNAFGDSQILDEPFKDSNEKVFTIVTNVSSNRKFDEKVNLYGGFEISDKMPEAGGHGITLADSHQVLFVHGKNSMNKNVEMPDKNSGLK